MALTATEEALLRDLLEKQAQLIALANNETTITAKLGSTKATIDDLTAATTVADSDLMIVRQDGVDKKLPVSVVKSGLVDLSSYAPLASPALTDTPTAPTAAAGTNTKQIASTAFVRGEVTSAIAALPSGGVHVQTFTASGTWTKPTNASASATVLIELISGGASGGKGTSGNSGGGGGGGGGGYMRRWMRLSDIVEDTVSVIVGAGGAAKTESGSAVGLNGGATSFGSYASIDGGGGGGRGVTAGAALGGCTGGGGGGLNSGTAGQPGGAGIFGGVVMYGAGGDSATSTVAGNPGVDGINGGGGGGGGRVSLVGQAGGNSIYGGGGGGGGGGGTSVGGTGGTSAYAGAGGGGGNSASGGDGAWPGGGGGGTQYGAQSGAGANGWARVTVFM